MIPPHIYEEIARRGTPAQRAKAIKSLARDQTLRAQRSVRAARVLARQSANSVLGDSGRRTYDAQDNRDLPGVLKRGEADAPLVDPEVDLVHDYVGLFREYLLKEHGRHSLDGNGLRLISSVRWDDDPSSPGYGNAMWNGEQTAYGKGDELFHSFGQIIDIPIHEEVHGLTMYTWNADYYGLPGAGNEGMSDRFGQVGKQYHLGQDVTQADWYIGKGIWRPHIVNGVALRSFRDEKAYGPDPLVGEDPQPKHWKDRYTGMSDSQGVHINSGIVNHAAMRMALEIGGRIWNKTAKIWFLSMTTKLMHTSDFHAQAAADYQSAVELFGTGSIESHAVKTGYKAVGLEVDQVPDPEPMPDSPCPPEVRAAAFTVLQGLIRNPDVIKALNSPSGRTLYAYVRVKDLNNKEKITS